MSAGHLPHCAIRTRRLVKDCTCVRRVPAWKLAMERLAAGGQSVTPC